ncbi:unnamed protein product [Tetraodon nigroviridis]|uniref:(spotted green pufferfish) hypothetical protein n=1 Tax=Tetraodon nigroviridis TaxID=99883 RepID=Q4RKM5_TETNG|nr:unnamed protein product [Tetraodon nigroviridis]
MPRRKQEQPKRLPSRKSFARFARFLRLPVCFAQ